ncbi:MAG: RNA polymerase sigma factor [Verrucomicrobiales bacterium]|nr:RNA polymerase sigma factor [Verrucomicrobiales bacterium]
MDRAIRRNTGEITDEWLVLRSQEGSPGALNLLLKRWQPKLAARAYHLTGAIDAAADISQETLIGISNGIRRLRDPNSFRSWAFSIVSNKSRDWIRKQTRERTLSDPMKANPETIIETSLDESGELLREALSLLERDDRELLRLHYYEGLSIIEISNIESIPAGTVKSRLFTAREHLRRKLNPNT